LALLHGHALGEVAGLIDVTAEEYAAVIGKELKRHNGQQRGHGFVRSRNVNDVIHEIT
jgi:hypothetical protein